MDVTRQAGTTLGLGPPNKGLKLTRPEHIEALQLNPGVRRTMLESR
jgi:hypothetical protein